ncbi:MAG: sulfatase-like hydrolase/transferase, partial [Acidobacteriota bacterium]
MSSRQASIFGRGAGPQRTLAAAAVLPLLAALAAGCGAPAPAENDAALAGPIVVITLSALPVDALGDATWTPALDELAARSWSNSALAPSSSPIPSLGSLLTGIDPWLHQAYSHRAGPMREGVPTLPQRLTEAGWSTRAFFPLHHRLHRFGFFAGFDSVEESGEDESTRSALRDAPDASLTWIHLPDPGFPYVDRREQLPRLPELQAETERIERRWLMPYADPELDMPEPLLSAAQELYRHQVAWADHRLGRLIEALRTNPRWERCTLIVTALHGNELAARGQVLFAQNLSRPSLEVPLIVRIPEGAGRDLPDSGAAVSTSRLAATVLD